MGIYFYPKSPRYAEPLSPEVLAAIPASIKKNRGFVNEDLENILTIVYKYKLNGVQLHGSEMVSMCAQLKEAGLIVIKAFPDSGKLSISSLQNDTKVSAIIFVRYKTDAYGGSGLKFNWEMLDEYSGENTFLPEWWHCSR